MEVDYPGNADIVYTRDADGRIASVSNGSTPVVTAISYLPFGPATQYTFASNGQTFVKSYDANYRATDITGSAINLHFALDKLGNIGKEGDTSGVPTPNESYQYDPLYRLKEVDGATGTLWQKYSYSKSGDRLSKNTVGITPADVYQYTPGTHHLKNITGADASARSFDLNGNTTALQANGWTYGLGYNNTNRLSLVQQNGTTIMQYKLDGKGERVRKVPTSGSATEYAYDEAGKLLYEYVGSSTNRSYIWAEDTLIATVEADSSTHYVYTDHLGTPRAVTTTTSSTPIWTWPWLQNLFGEKPASGSAYALNVRYPGQYYDAETGLNYSYFRDYEPATGQYMQSDPLGLFGGQISTYSYADNDPLSNTDPLGKYVTCTSTSCTIHEGDSLLELGIDYLTVKAIQLQKELENERQRTQCPPNDDDFCFNRWEAESAKCVIWGSLGSRWVRACRDRARYRFQLCVQNGGTPDPSEPPPWTPSEDYPH